MDVKKCKFYNFGSCKYGNNCRYQHDIDKSNTYYDNKISKNDNIRLPKFYEDNYYEDHVNDDGTQSYKYHYKDDIIYNHYIDDSISDKEYVYNIYNFIKCKSSYYCSDYPFLKEWQEIQDIQRKIVIKI